MSDCAWGTGGGARRRRGRTCRLLVALHVAGLALAGTSPLPAQTAVSPNRQAIDAAGARVDSLRPLLERLSTRWNRVREAQRQAEIESSRVAVDTFMVGPLRVAAPPGQRDLAREVFQYAWREWEPTLRGSEEIVAGRLFVLLPGRHRSPGFLGDSTDVLTADARISEEILRRNAYLRVGAVVVPALPEQVTLWVGGFAGATRSERVWTFRELVTAPSRAARGCYRGEAPWCWDALGLADTVGALERWYTPEERRHLVKGSAAGASASRRAALWSACVDGESDRACDLFLQEQGLPPPLSPAARASFLGHALRVGGEGALERLRRTGNRSVRERLLEASGVSPDSLALSWRAELLRARPSAWAGLGRTQLALLGWLLLLAFLATRSTRWRLG